jgi:4-hydroxy-tetrahydrodipicolinate reductase
MIHMRIALIGYGKMGHMIEEMAVERGHEIVLRIHIDNLHEFTRENLSVADVAIEFTGPESAFENVKKCLNWNVPVVSGSTGWNRQIEAAKEICREQKGSFLHASNFSVGVNIFFEVNRLLAKLMSVQPAYSVSLKEIHHTQKKDAPSGTAVTLAEGVMEHLKQKKGWVNAATATPDQIPILSERVDPAPGTHHVKYSSDIDDIEIIHTAHNRKGFALGAVIAAEYIQNKKGVFTMKEVLGL